MTLCHWHKTTRLRGKIKVTSGGKLLQASFYRHSSTVVAAGKADYQGPCMRPVVEDTANAMYGPANTGYSMLQIITFLIRRLARLALIELIISFLLLKHQIIQWVIFRILRYN